MMEGFVRASGDISAPVAPLASRLAACRMSLQARVEQTAREVEYVDKRKNELTLWQATGLPPAPRSVRPPPPHPAQDCRQREATTAVFVPAGVSQLHSKNKFAHAEPAIRHTVRADVARWDEATHPWVGSDFQLALHRSRCCTVSPFLG